MAPKRPWRDVWQGVAEDLKLGTEDSPYDAHDLVVRGSLSGVLVECETGVRVSGRHPEGSWSLPSLGPVTRVRATPASPPSSGLRLDVAPHSGLWPAPATTGDPAFDQAFSVRGGDSHLARAWLSGPLRANLLITSGWRFVVRGGRIWGFVGRLEQDPLPLASALRAVVGLALRPTELGESLRQTAEHLGAARTPGAWRGDESQPIELELGGIAVRIHHPCEKGALETRALVRREAGPDAQFLLAARGQTIVARGPRVRLPDALAAEYEASAFEPAHLVARLTPSIIRELLAASPGLVVADRKQVLLRTGGFVVDAARVRAIAEIVSALATPQPEGQTPYR